MVDIDIRAEFKPALAMLASLERNLQDKVIARTLNRIGDATRLEASRRIVADYALTSAEVKSLITVVHASWSAGLLRVSVIARGRHGRALNVIRFVEKSISLAQARKRRKAGTLGDLRVRIRKAGGWKALSQPEWAAGKPFVLTANKGTFVAARVGAGRKVRSVLTIDVGQMFASRKVTGILLAKIRSDFPQEFARQLAAVERGF